ncbi:MAG: hypothetical protein J6Y89_09335 [Lachnospiraceae bacterium]|nr:hypothetical protein [Lachnospiraceae bacterium]
MNSNVRMPSNVLTKGYLLGKPIGFWIEALVMDLIAVAIVLKLPLRTAPKIMLLLFLVLGLTIVFLRGIKNRSVFQTLRYLIVYYRRKRRLHLTTPNYMKRIKYEEASNESVAEHYEKIFKQRINGFIDKYAVDENSENGKED